MSKLKVISTTEARKRFAQIADELRDGKTTYSVERHGTEVFRMVPTHTNQEIDSNLETDIQEFFSLYGDVLTELAKR